MSVYKRSAAARARVGTAQYIEVRELRSTQIARAMVH